MDTFRSPRSLPALTRRALWAALALAGLLVLLWFAEFHVGVVQRLDARIFNGFFGIGERPHVWGLASSIAGLCDPSRYVFLCLAPVAIALARRRFLLAAVIVATLLAANMTTEVLKPLLAAPRPAGVTIHHVSEVSWPSGHATAAMVLALCLVLACPARRRPFAAALGAAFAVAVSYSFLSLGWHYPSDVLGGFLVASIWTLLAVAGYTTYQEGHGRGIHEPRPRDPAAAEALAPSAVLLAAVLLVAVLVAAVRPAPVLDYVSAHTAFVVGAAGIGALAMLLSAGFALALRRGPQSR